MISDLRHEAERTQEKKLTSIFFGGGTPSLMPPHIVEAIIDEASALWSVDDGLEISLEANPSSVEAGRFQDLALSGVNRVSLGLQSLRTEALDFLGRAHSVDEAHAALAIAQSCFARVNIDLIYARPGQSTEDWSKELAEALALGTGHLSLYQLTIEPGTRFETLVAQGKLQVMEPDEAATLFELTADMTEAAGVPGYEISNHARPGEECRHNLAYWRYSDYCGVGPGAHGRRGGFATLRHKKPENWLSAVSRNSHGTQNETPLTPEERAREALVMGLRLAEGVSLSKIAKRFGLEANQLIHREKTIGLAKHGLIEAGEDHVRVLPPGRLLLDRILAEIVAI